MKKVVLGMLLLMSVCFFANYAKADTEWNTKKTITVRKGGYTFCSYLSSDGKECWLNEIRIHPKRGDVSTLKIPDKMKGAVVTRIGYDQDRNGEDHDFGMNLFSVWVEMAHGCDGYMSKLKKVTKLVLPSGLEQIDYVCFSGMDYIKEVVLPARTKAVDEGAFYDCDSLEKLVIPKSMESFNSEAFSNCYHLKKISVAKKSKYYKTKNNMLLTKNGKRFVWIAPAVTKAKIPTGVKMIERGCLESSSLNSLSIPKTVNCIDSMSITSPDLVKVSLASGNKVYAKDGQCIYKKNTHELVVAIAKKKKVVISNKVREISSAAMTCGDGFSLPDGSGIEVVDIATSVKTVRGRWIDFCHMNTGGKVYFRGLTPPQLVDKDVSDAYASLPIFMKIYVPKQSVSLYQDWYVMEKCYDFIKDNKLYTF